MSLIDLIGVAGPGAHLAARRAGVAHVTTGPLTPSGRFAAVPCRTVCRAHNRRLTVLPERFASLATDRPVPTRLCALCVAGLSPSPESPAMAQLNRDQLAARYSGITLEELAVALTHATSSEEAHRISRITLTVFGPPVIRTGRNRDRLTRDQHDLVDLAEAINKSLTRFRSAERTPEQRAADVAKQHEDAEFALAAIQQRRRADWQEREREKARRRGISQPTPPTTRRRPATTSR